AGMCIVFVPSTTGELVKPKVIVAFPFDKVAVFAGVPLTVKSVGWTVLGSAASLRLTTNDEVCVLITLLHAGTVLVTAKPTSSLSVKTSCWDALLIATRPSTHEVRCCEAT